MEIVHHHPVQASGEVRSRLLERLYQSCVAQLREPHRVPPPSAGTRGR